LFRLRGCLLQLLLQLFSVAAQLFLLPALLRRQFLTLFLLLVEFLLALGQLLELLQRVIDLLLPLLGGLRAASALVLILFRVEFEVEKALKIARGAASAAASTRAATLPESHLDIAHGSLGAQQELQCLLLRHKRGIPFGALQFVGRRLHVGNGLVHVVYEVLERIAGFLELTGLHAIGERLRLVTQFALHA